MILVDSATSGGADIEQPAAHVGQQKVRTDLPDVRIETFGHGHLVEGRRPHAAIARNGKFASHLHVFQRLNQ